MTDDRAMLADEVAVAGVDDPLVVVDPDYRPLEHNAAAAELFPGLGAPPEPPADAAPERLRSTLPALPSGESVTEEVRVDGDWYEVRVYPDDPRYTALYHEVTERKRRRAELERYETVLEALPQPVYVTDEDGVFTFVNEATLDLYGYLDEFDPEEVTTARVAAEMGMRPEDLERAQDAIRRCLSNGGETGDWEAVEMVGFTKDGERVPIENRQAIHVEDGEFRGTFGTLHDVSDRIRRRKRLRVLDRVLRHNIRTEVSLLTGYADRIERETDDPETLEAVAAIRRTGRRLVEISDETRAVESAIVGEESPNPTDLRELVESVVRDVEASYPEATIELAIDGDPTVRGGSALEVVFEELLENAVVHNDGPEPTVRIASRRAPVDVDTHIEIHPQNETVVVEIADDGPGIPEDERALVAGDAEISPLTHSDGLGLWTAAWVVQEYGGKVEIRDRDRKGGGTVVEVYLPAGE